MVLSPNDLTSDLHRRTSSQAYSKRLVCTTASSASSTARACCAGAAAPADALSAIACSFATSTGESVLEDSSADVADSLKSGGYSSFADNALYRDDLTPAQVERVRGRGKWRERGRGRGRKEGREREHGMKV